MPQPPANANPAEATKAAPALPEPAGRGNGFSLDALGLAGTVVAAIGGGLGVLGFVAFFGAAILWVRLDEAGLPANEALAVMPRSVLISTGASFVAPALMLAAALTFLAYLIEGGAQAWKRRLLDTQKLADFDAAREEAEEKRKKLKAMQDVAAGIEPASGDAATGRVIANQMSTAEAELEQVESRQQSKEEALRSEASRSKKFGLAERAWDWASPALVSFIFIGGASLMSICLSLSSGRSALLIAAAVVLSISCGMLRRTLAHFAWFALATFLSTCVLAATLTYFRTIEYPKVSPVALLRTDGPPVYGIYVTQTSDRVYLGTKPTLTGTARLSSFKRDEVLQVVVGSLQLPTVAEERAIAFARRLCTQAQARPINGTLLVEKGGKEAEEVATGCTADDLDDLDAYIASRRAQEDEQVSAN